MKKRFKRGFTLAEVLITLSVIGIVAAITLPALTSNVQEKAWEAQRKALHARMAQALGSMRTLAGYGEYTAKEEGVSDGVDTAAETFVVDGLQKVYKIKNICDASHVSDCNFPWPFINGSQDSASTYPLSFHELSPAFTDESSYNSDVTDTKPAFFSTANGESLALYYNPTCKDIDRYTTLDTLCVNMIYDLNGKKSPNKIGKDMGVISVFGRKSPIVVAPMLKELEDNTDVGPIEAKYYNEDNNKSAGQICKNKDGRLPDLTEALSLAANKRVFGVNLQEGYWLTGSVASAGQNGKVYAIEFPDIRYLKVGKTSTTAQVYCIEE